MALIRPGVKASPERVRAALTGRVGDHHRFLLGLHLRQIDALSLALADIDAQVERDLGPFREAVSLPATIPGVSNLTAQVILAEIGPDMSRFPSAGHLISWAGLCPRNDESAGKRRSTRLKKGAPWLKTLRGLTPFEFIHQAWTKQPERFRINPSHLIPGPYT